MVREGTKRPDPVQAAMQEKLLNNEVARNVRREFGKHAIDASKVTVAVRRGTVSLFGKFEPMRGKEPLFEDELEATLKAIHDLPHVHTVVRQK